MPSEKIPQDPDSPPRLQALHRLITRREMFFLTSSAAASLLLGGCGAGSDGTVPIPVDPAAGGNAGVPDAGTGGGNTGGSVAPPPPPSPLPPPPDQGDFFQAANVQVKPEVVVLPGDGSMTISAVTENSLTLSGSVPPLQPGSVIVSGQEAGLMRRVTAVSASGAATVLATETAGLTDVFASATIQFRQGLRMSDVQEVQPLVPGVQVGPASRLGRQATPNQDGIAIILPKTFIGEDIGDGVQVGVEISSDGVLDFDLNGDIDITFANGLEKLEMIQETTWTGKYTIQLKGKGNLPALTKSLVYATFIFNPIPLGFVGPVPIVLLPVLFLQLATKGAISGGWETTGDGTASYRVGFRYLQNPLGSDFEFGDVDGIAEASHTGNFVPSNFFGSLKLEVTPIQPELQTSFNGVIGPTFKADLPALVAEVKTNKNVADVNLVNSVDITADVIFRGIVGAKAGLLGLAQAPLFETTIVEKKIPLFNHTFQAGVGNVSVQ